MNAARRLVILAEGCLDRWNGKTALGVIRYCPDEVACVLDSTRAGQDLVAAIGMGEGISIVATAKDALATEPTGLLIGIATAGGALPEEFRAVIRAFLERGLDVISGLHLFVSDDDEFAALAEKSGATIQDLRKPPPGLPVAANRALQHKGLRLQTVGTDCCLGKMATALDIFKGAREAGWDAEFVATGQTGIAIAGSGIAVDAVVSDFVGGAAEQLVLDNAKHELLVIEGQGSLTHPGFSGVTLGLLHGAAPQALILCHEPAREHHDACETPVPVPGLETLLPLYEQIAGINFPCKVVGISLNTASLAPGEARRTVDETQERFGLPVTDPFRYGVKNLVDALEEFR